MKNYILLIILFAGSMFGSSARAQEAETKALVDNLVAMTMPGYYARQNVSDLIPSIESCDDPDNCAARVALPVELLYFTGVRVDEASVLLKWETAGEVNNDYFQVERTLNPAQEYENVGTIKGNGTTSSDAKYQFPDPNGYDTYTYYRLKQVDYDGSFNYSTIIAIRGGAGPLVVTAFPNPGQAKHIRFKLSGLRQPSGAMVSVYDVKGVIIYQNSNQKVSPEGNVTLNLPDVPSGKYTLRVSIGDRESVSSFVLVQ